MEKLIGVVLGALVAGCGTAQAPDLGCDPACAPGRRCNNTECGCANGVCGYLSDLEPAADLQPGPDLAGLAAGVDLASAGDAALPPDLLGVDLAGTTDLQLPPGPLRIFTTISPHDGNLGGLAGATAMCQAAAKDAGYIGTFVALLGGPKTGNPVDRIRLGSDAFRKITRPDGTQVAMAGTFWTAMHDAPIEPRPAAEAWANFDVNGKSAAEDACSDWTSNSQNGGATTGGPTATDKRWATDGTSSTCDGPGVLYCLEQP